MKKALAALILLVALAPLAALAQSSIVAQIAGDKAASEKLYFALKLGANFSYLIGAPENSGRTGNFNIGLSATIRLSDRLSLVPEITPFFRRGATEQTFVYFDDPLYLAPPDVADSTGAVGLDYLDCPILLKYRLGRFEIGAGPYVAFLMTAKETLRLELVSGEIIRYSRDVSDQYKKTDFGLVVEGSWTVTKPRRGVGLVLHGRYEHGLTDVLAAPAPSGPLRNSVWHFYASFPFVF